ncbi:MAG: hypothetical protein JXB03_02985, partial [Spirochaetales bacterium]|nr:hypothetical protein [Spirochaetales bacterium]
AGCSGPEHILLTNPPLQVRSQDDQQVAWIQRVPDTRVMALQEEDRKLIAAFNGGLVGGKYDAITAIIMSRDGKHIAYPAFSGGSWKMVHDGVESPFGFDEIPPGAVSISDDGTVLAYAARTGDEWMVLRNREPVREKYGPVEQVLLSPDGTRLCFVTVKGEKRAVVQDGSIGPLFDRVSGLVFSPDGSRLAYKAEENGQRFVVVDGVRGSGWDETGMPLFSHDGSSIAYSALQDEQAFVVKDGRVLGQGYPMGMLIEPLRFSPSDRRLCYAVDTGRGWAAVVDGAEKAIHQIVLGDSMVLSPDGRGLAYVATDGDGWYVMGGGISGPRADSIALGAHPFSNDGSRFIYALQSAGEWHLEVDGRMTQALPFEEISMSIGPGFSSDGTRYYYAGKRGDEWHLVVNGREGSGYGRLYRPAFNEEGTTHLAETAGDGWLVRSFVPDPGKPSATDRDAGESFVRLSPPTLVPAGEEECIPCKVRKQNMTFEELMNEKPHSAEPES